MRRRHERRCTLPRFGALLGDNTPSPTLRGLHMITKALVSTKVLLELYARSRRRQGLLPSRPRYESSPNRLGTLYMGALGGLYRPTAQGYNGNLAGCRTRLSVSLVAGCWGPPPGLVRSRQAAPAACGSGRRLITIAAMLMTHTWSGERGYSPAAWWEITVATLRLFWLMAHGPRGRKGPPARGRPPSGPTGQTSAVFRALAAW